MALDWILIRTEFSEKDKQTKLFLKGVCGNKKEFERVFFGKVPDEFIGYGFGLEGKIKRIFPLYILEQRISSDNGMKLKMRRNFLYFDVTYYGQERNTRRIFLRKPNLELINEPDVRELYPELKDKSYL